VVSDVQTWYAAAWCKAPGSEPNKGNGLTSQLTAAGGCALSDLNNKPIVGPDPLGYPIPAFTDLTRK